METDSIQVAIQQFRVLLDSVQVILPPNNPYNWNNLIALIIAALAVFFGPLIQFNIAKRQMRIQEEITKKQIAIQNEIATKQIETQNRIAIKQINAAVLAANRQDWIHKLRENIAAFVSLNLLVKDMQNRNIENGLSEKIEQLHYRLTKIKLLINPNEVDHIQLINALDQSVKSLSQENLSKIEELAQKILKAEWNRVKQLD